MSEPRVRFFFDSVQIPLKDRSGVKRFIEKLILNEGGQLVSLNYVFCTDERLLEINQGFLNHNNYTDIITFNLSRKSQVIEGEIYISVDRVKENAHTFNVSYTAELLRVIFHGALHLCGYRDKSVPDRQNMRKAEDKWLDMYRRST